MALRLAWTPGWTLSRRSLSAAVTASASISLALPLALRDLTSRFAARTITTRPGSHFMFRNELLKRVPVVSTNLTEARTLTMAKEGNDDGPMYSIEERGSLYTLDYRVYFKDKSGRYLSPWHEIPLYANKEELIYNMIVEIPRWTNAKMEMATKERLSPIRQDVKKGMPRFVDNVFPHHGYIWNYGALPQTWEDPNRIDEGTKAKGDNDPIDVIEIGSKIHPRGSVVQVKVVGAMALIDEGETDWKLVALDVTDPVAPNVNCCTDVDKYFPGLLQATHEWFRVYKVPAGKPVNVFGFNGRFLDPNYAKTIIDDTHLYWKMLIADKEQTVLNTECCLEGAGFFKERASCAEVVEANPPLGPPGKIPASLDRWHFITD